MSKQEVWKVPQMGTGWLYWMRLPYSSRSFVATTSSPSAIQSKVPVNYSL